MREAIPSLSHQHRHRADDQQQQPQTLRNADHAKAARYQCDHHRVVSQGDHFVHQNQSAPRCTDGERYEAHERDHVSKPGGPHGQSSSSYWRATWHNVEGSLSRGTKKRAKQRRISIDFLEFRTLHHQQARQHKAYHHMTDTSPTTVNRNTTPEIAQLSLSSEGISDREGSGSAD